MPIVWSLSILVGFFSVFSTLRSLTGLTGACASDVGALNVCNSITKFYWRNRPAGCAGFFVAAHGNSSSLLTERRQAQHGFVLQRLCAWRRRGHHRCCRWPRSLCWLPTPRPAWLRATPGSASSCFEVSSRQTSGRRSRPGQLLVGSRRLTYLPLKKS